MPVSAKGMSALESVRPSSAQDEIPTSWYNIQADLPERLPPPLDPGTHQPMSPEPLFRIFPKELVAQEVSQERWIEDPEEVLEAYRWLPAADARLSRLQARELPEDPRRRSTTSGRVPTLQGATSRTLRSPRPTTT